MADLELVERDGSRLDHTVSDQTKTFDERAIISKVIAGDKNEFRHLVLRYKDTVFALVMRQVGDRDLAEEITQESFIKAYLNLGQFRFDSRFSTWLVRIALNQTSSYYSSRKFKEKQKTESFDRERHEMSAGNNEDIKKEEEQHRLFRSALGQLTRKLREAVVLCGLEGRSYEEAATILDIPVGTVRSRLNAARLKLKDAVGGIE